MVTRVETSSASSPTTMAQVTVSKLTGLFKQGKYTHVSAGSQGSQPSMENTALQMYGASQMGYFLGDVHSVVYLLAEAANPRILPSTIGVSSTLSTGTMALTGACNAGMAYDKAQRAKGGNDAYSAHLSNLAVIRGGSEASVGVVGMTAVALQAIGRASRKLQVSLNQAARALGTVSSGLSFLCYAIMSILYGERCIQALRIWNSLDGESPQESIDALKERCLKITGKELDEATESISKKAQELIGKSTMLTVDEYKHLEGHHWAYVEEQVGLYLERNASHIDGVGQAMVATQVAIRLAKKVALISAYKQERFGDIFGDKALQALHNDKMEEQIHKDFTISEIFSRFPHKSQKLAQEMSKLGLQCVGCGASTFETLEMGVFGHGLDQEALDQLIERLNAILAIDATEQLGKIRSSAIKTCALNGATVAIAIMLITAMIFMNWGGVPLFVPGISLYLIGCVLALVVDTYFLRDAIESEPKLTKKTQVVMALCVATTIVAMVLGILYASSPLMFGVAIGIGASTLLVEFAALARAYSKSRSKEYHEQHPEPKGIELSQ